MLSKPNLSELTYETIRWAMKFDEAQNNIERYAKSKFTGMIFGAVDEWLRQGMKETTEEITLLASTTSVSTKLLTKIVI